MRPDSHISNRLRRSVENAPLAKRIAVPIYRRYVIAYAKFLTWVKYGRKHEAPIDPFELVRIDPGRVVGKQRHKEEFEYPDPVSEVRPGDWDQDYVPIEEYWMYRSFHDRFVHELLWEETELYRRSIEAIQNGETKWGCRSVAEFEDRLQRIDALYQLMSEEGYKTQEEMETEMRSDPIRRRIHDYWPPALKEVTINVGRDGGLILHDGRHRLLLSRIIGIEEIPARVKVRHGKWQRQRDAIAKCDVSEQDHPDLKASIQSR